MVLAPYQNPNAVGQGESIKPEVLKNLNSESWRRIRKHYKAYYPIKWNEDDLRIIHCGNISLAQIVSQPGRNPVIKDGEPPELDASERTFPLAEHKNTIWYDANGVKLIQYFPRMFSKGYEPVLLELQRLFEEHPPHRPSSEKRSRLYNYWLQQLPPNTKSGVLRLTIHHQNGHHRDFPLASQDLLCGSGTHNTASLNFRKSPAIIDIAEKVSCLFAAVDPDSWREYREVYVKMGSYKKYSYLRDWDPTNIQCFIGHYLLFNILTTIHRDLKDPKSGWAAMLVLGVFKDGSLCFPDIGVALPYQPGDLVFMRSWALEHFIRRYKGVERYVIVFSTPASLFNWEPPKI
jgi:hypothetical protein